MSDCGGGGAHVRLKVRWKLFLGGVFGWLVAGWYSCPNCWVIGGRVAGSAGGRVGGLEWQNDVRLGLVYGRFFERSTDGGATGDANIGRSGSMRERSFFLLKGAMK